MSFQADLEVHRADPSALSAGVAELSRAERALRDDLARAQQAERVLREQLDEQQRVIERLTVAQALVDSTLDGITLTSMEGHVVYANAAFKAMSGFGERAVGSALPEFYSPENYARLQEEVVPALLGPGTWTGLLEIRRPDGTAWMAQTSGFLIKDASGAPAGMAGFFRDVTAALEAERAQQRLQAELILAQQRALRALGTPLMPIADQVIAMPLIGDIDRERAAQIMEALLDGITRHRAAVAILDVTGVEMVDMQVANALVQAAHAARLLGVEVVMTGVSTRVAQTLVSLGAELRGVITRGDLQSGIAYALARRRR